MTQSVTQHICLGLQRTLEPSRGLDLLLSYVMSEHRLFVHFQKTQIKEYEKEKSKKKKKKGFLHKLIVTSKLPCWKNHYVMQCQ